MLIISAAKKVGLTFDELNELGAQDLIDLLYVYTGESKNKAHSRAATQADIDKFLR